MSENRQLGPTNQKRSCTDCLWFILLIIVWIGMALITWCAVSTGNLNRLEYGRDSQGNLCGSPIGVDSALNLVNKKQLLYFSVDMENGYRMCVESCPTANGQTVCQYGITPSASSVTLAQQISSGDCAVTLESVSLMNRCVPKQLAQQLQSQTAISVNSTLQKYGQSLGVDLNSLPTAEKIYQDFLATWWIILACCGVALVLSFAWLIIAQLFSGLIVWLTLFGTLIVSWGCSAFLWTEYYLIYVAGQKAIQTGIGSIDAQLYNQQVLLALSIGFTVVTFILTCIVAVAFKRIRLAVQVIKEASRAMRSVPTILILPIFKYIVLLGLIAFFAFIYALLSTSGTVIASQVSYTVNSVTQTNLGLNFQVTNYQYLQIFHTFGFLWTYNWIIAIGQTAVAGAIATWYFTKEKSKIPTFTVAQSVWRTIRYHMGSLALGSLLIATVQLIRYLMIQATQKVKKLSNDSTLVKVACCCLQCCLWCVEKFLKMLSKNAYIEIAITGKSFCSSCRTALKLLTQNCLRLAAVDGVSGFIIFLGKLGVVAGSTICGIAGLSHFKNTDNPVSNWSVPLLMIVIFTWIIASGFMSVYEMSIDTIFFCVLEDAQTNDGSADKPYFMSAELQKIMDKSNRAESPSKEKPKEKTKSKDSKEKKPEMTQVKS